ITGTAVFSPDSKRVGYPAQLDGKWFTVIDGQEQKQYNAIAEGTLTFSPDSKRLVYMAKENAGWFAVVDGKEQKQHRAMGQPPTFSPDSKHLAYAAMLEDKCLVVLDGRACKQYDGLVTIGGGRIVFDPPDSLYYLATKARTIYFVTESIQSD
ncbi:MAG: TolB family protein, partial [Planctomycetota bacterium]